MSLKSAKEFLLDLSASDEVSAIISSLDLREKLKKEFEFHNFKILRKLESKDGTKKYLLLVKTQVKINNIV